MDVQYEVMKSNDLMIQGERRTFLNVPPLDTKEFAYRLIPVSAGYVSLPQVRLSNESGNFVFVKDARKRIFVEN